MNEILPSDSIHNRSNLQQRISHSETEEIESNIISDVQNTIPCANLTIDQKLRAIQACLSYAVYEANVYWRRNAIYLTINSIMLGVIGTSFKSMNTFLILALSFFGVYLNWSWVYVNRYSKFLAERWREDARALAADSQEISNYMRALLRHPRIQIPPGKKPSQVMNQLGGSFRILWILLTLYSLYVVLPIIFSYICGLSFPLIINNP